LRALQLAPVIYELGRTIRAEAGGIGARRFRHSRIFKCRWAFDRGVGGDRRYARHWIWTVRHRLLQN